MRSIALMLLLTACAPSWQELRDSDVTERWQVEGTYLGVAGCSLRALEANASTVQYRLIDEPAARAARISAAAMAVWFIYPRYEISFRQADSRLVAVEIRERWTIQGNLYAQATRPVTEHCAKSTTKSP